MNIHYLQHVPFEELGCIRNWAEKGNHQLTQTRFFEDEVLPPVDQIDWLIIMGGPMGVYDFKKYSWLDQEMRFVENAIQANKTIIGVCLGAQILAKVLGARIYKNPITEIGWFPIQPTPFGQAHPLFDGINKDLSVFHWHGDTFDLPEGAVNLARSQACENQAFVYDQNIIGLQFHLEMTKSGAKELISNCSDELVEGQCIQSAENILMRAEDFEQTNAQMHLFLSKLEYSQSKTTSKPY